MNDSSPSPLRPTTAAPPSAGQLDVAGVPSQSNLAYLLGLTPQSPWSPSRRIAALARAILAVIVALMVAAPFIVEEPHLFWLFYMPHLFGTCACLVAVRLGRPRLALTLGVGMSFLGLSIELYYWGGITTHDVVGFPVLVAIVGVLWNVRAAVTTALACAGSLTIAALVENAGYLQPPIAKAPVFQALLGSYGALGVMAVAMVVVNRLLETAVRSTEETHARFAALVHQSPDALVFMDRDGRVQFMNNAAVQMSGYSREEILGLRMDELPFFPQPFREIAMQTYRELMAAGGEPPPREALIENKDGSRVFVEVNRRRVELPDGSMGIQYTIRDVSERRRHELLRAELQQRIQEAQKLETIGQLAGGVAHDFNNLLTVILGQSELLLHQPLPDKTHAQVRQILQAGDRARLLTQQLLAYARKQMIEPRSIDPGAAIRDLHPLLQTLVGPHVQLVLDLHPAVGQIRVDPSQFDQVLTNLVANARDALPGTGTVTIGTRALEKPAAGKEAHGPGRRYCRIFVEDDGHGMTPDVQRRIFEPFFTTKAPARGTGLGLAVVDGIVSQNGGQIAVRSAPGQGTRFSLDFPLVDTPAEVPTTPPGPHARGIAPTLLLVEDENLVRDTTERMLRALGYEVVVAASGPEALHLYESHPRDTFALVMTDIMMPDQSGPQLVDQLRARGYTRPVIFMSGYVRDGLGDELPSGSCFLRKPFSAQGLSEQINALLAAHASGQSLPTPAPIVPP